MKTSDLQLLFKLLNNLNDEVFTEFMKNQNYKESIDLNIKHDRLKAALEVVKELKDKSEQA